MSEFKVGDVIEWQRHPGALQPLGGVRYKIIYTFGDNEAAIKSIGSAEIAVNLSKYIKVHDYVYSSIL